MTRSPATFLVVGGGIGGLATALQIARRGIGRVSVLERTAEFGEVGAGIQLAPNASAVLDQLGVLDAVTRTAFKPARLVLRDALTAEEITALHTGEAFAERYGYPYIVAHRADLHGALLAACVEDDRIDLHPGTTVIRAEPETGGVVVHDESGRTHRADAVVGADGIASALRRQLLADGDVVGTGYVAYRGVIPINRARRSGGGDSSDMVIWIGPRLHLVQYPVRGGELLNQVAVFRSEEFVAGSSEWGTPEELDKRFSISAEPVRQSVALIDRRQRWEMYDREPHSGWASGRIALLGDAAHPMFQYLAQGACQALEDSCVIADCLAKFPDPEVAFKAYEDQRFERASTVQTRARGFGEVLHADGALAEMRNYFLRQRPDTDFTPVDWLYSPSM